MKLIYLKKQTISFIYRNRLTFILLFLCLVAGIAAGSIFSVTLPADVFDELCEYINNFVSAYSLQKFDSASVVQYSLINNGKTLIILFLSCLWRGFVPVPFLQCFFKGLGFSFTITTIIRLFGAKGIPFAVVGSMPQMLIFTPFFIFYCVYNVNNTLSAGNSSGQGIRKSVNKLFNIKNLLLIFALVFVAIITALLDGYAVPLVLKPLCSILGK